MESTKTELTVRSPAELIMEAVKGNTDLAKLRELLEIQKDWEANEARKAYHLAMSEFKANPPEISKNKRVNFKTEKGGAVNYHHATLAHVTERINSALAQHGLSAAWAVLNHQDNVTVTCRITHKDGHSEETSISAPRDQSGSKNHVQSIGSTISYLQRYTLLALTGLATQDQDDDGAASAGQQLKAPERTPAPAAHIPPAAPAPAAVKTEPPAIPAEDLGRKINISESTELLAFSYKNGVAEVEVDRFIAFKFKIKRRQDLTLKQYEEVKAWIESAHG